MEIQDILKKGSNQQKLALFQFNVDEPTRNIVLKFNLWTRYFFPKFFTVTDAPFHQLTDEYLVNLYKGEFNSFTNIAFRGSGKTTRIKLFLAYVIANDINHSKRFLKVLSKDLQNAKQIVTDVYNMFVDRRVKVLYPDIFKKSDLKREETMGGFTTSYGVKITADTVGTDQRGQLQDEARPDFILFEDFETRKTLRSAVETKAIWDNMEEARTGLAQYGGCVYNCNYISERGNVHKLVKKKDESNIVLITPIIHKGTVAWKDKYTKEQIEQIKKDADDFEGEYLCSPSATFDIMFNRQVLDNMPVLEPIRVSAGFKLFKRYNPSHRYAGGHDISKGVGLDSSASVFIDFSTNPAQVVGTFASNEIQPETFGDEIYREADFFGQCLVAPENNYESSGTIGRLRQLKADIYMKQGKITRINTPAPTEYGWNTNQSTKPQMMFDLMKAVEDGQLLLNDEALIAEARSYARDDLMDREIDPRLTTRHFDLLTAAAICFQMRNFAKVKQKEIWTMENNNETLNPAI